MVSVPEGCPSTSTTGPPVPIVELPSAPVPLKPTILQETSLEMDIDLPSNNISIEIDPEEEKPLVIDFPSIVAKAKSRLVLPVRPVSPIELSKIKFQCLKCPNNVTTEFSLSHFFLHQYSAHSCISCIYCEEDFQYAREVMVHLHREHRLTNQKFESDDEFMRRGGGRTTVICVECNSLLQLAADTDPNVLKNHECRKPLTCRDCGLVLENTTIELHSQMCSHGKVDRKNFITKGKASDLDECRFCKRKISSRGDGQGQGVCSVCEKIGVHNLIVKMPTPMKKVNLPLSPAQLPPIPQLTLSSARKPIRAIPPLIPYVNPVVSDRYKKNSGSPLDRKSTTVDTSRSAGKVNSDISRINFSSSITVTSLNSALDENGVDDTGRKIPSTHSILSQESPDLSRPKRSSKRVNNEDFMYEKHLKRRVSSPVVSITPVPPFNPTKPEKLNDRISVDLRGEEPEDEHSHRITENGLDHVPQVDDWICSREGEVPVPEIKLDPLLLEPDSAKRIKMLTSELAQMLVGGWKQISAKKHTETTISSKTSAEFNSFSIVVSGKNFKEDSVLNQMVEESSISCIYCRQAKLTRVDKRQMILHLLRHHSWEIRLAEEKATEKPEKTEELETAPEPENAGADTKEKMEVDRHEVPNIEIKVENDNDTDIVQVSEPRPNSETALVVPEILDPLKSDLVIKSVEPKVEDDKKSLAIEHNGTITLVKPKANGTGDNELMEYDREAFCVDILAKVLSSEELVFKFVRHESLEFGQSPCECLICGFLSNSQVNLFPHWRKAHGGMAMKCPMCHGNFLFAAALFSHVCLGTPKYFVSALSPGQKTGSSETLKEDESEGGKSQSENSLVAGCTTNDTITLRYHCGFCEDLKLPGFFNYMVHLRKDHLSCELCLETLASQKELEHHMKKHKLSHFCWKCNISYVSKPNLQTHLFWKHGTESRECSVCLKKKWPHIFHSCIPPPWFTCDVCGLFFTKSKSLLVHKRLHTRQKLRECPECSTKFISASLLRKHLDTPHGPLCKPLESQRVSSQNKREEKETSRNSSPRKRQESPKDKENVTGITTIALPPEDLKINGCESEDSNDEADEMDTIPKVSETVPQSTFVTPAPKSLRLNLTATMAEVVVEEKTVESTQACSAKPETEQGELSETVSTICEDKVIEPQVIQPGFPAPTPRLDLSSTATAMLFDEKAIFDRPMSPLLHPLDDFPMSPPQVPGFEIPDHISIEVTKNIILHDHCYSQSQGDLLSLEKSVEVVEERQDKEESKSKPISPKKSIQVSATVTSARKRKRSRSSSSSSSSSSCSSCGPNCSCSSSSSSSSSSSNDSTDSSDSETNSDSGGKDHVINRKSIAASTPFPRKRGRKPKPRLEEPPKVKKPKGRPPKGSKRVKGLRMGPQPTGNGLGNQEAEILKHFENPMDAFIVEEDLDTTDSDSEQMFYTKQLTESIIPIPPMIEEPWMIGTEKFLLKEVKGVNDLEELRSRATTSTEPELSGVESPINRLIVRRTPGSSESFLSNSGRHSIGTPKNVVPSSGTGTVETKKLNATMKLGRSVSMMSSPKSITLPSQANSPAITCTELSTSSFPIGTENQISKDKNNCYTPSSDKSIGLDPPAQTPTPKRRRARMKVTEVKRKVTPPPLPVTPVTDVVTEEKLYCICQGPHDNVSQMIGCDAKDCPYQWFHFECVGILVAPKGKWFCTDCKSKRRASAIQGKKFDSPGGLISVPDTPSPKSGSGGRPRGFTNNAFIGHTVS